MGTFGREGKVFAVRLDTEQRAKLDACITRTHEESGSWRRAQPLGEFMREAALEKAAGVLAELDARKAATAIPPERSTARSRGTTKPVGMPTTAQRIRNANRARR